VKWTALEVARTLLLRQGRHFERTYTDINRLTNTLAARDGRQRDHYTWCTLHAAQVARTLGYERITVIEFGVAGGNGLIALERAAEWATTCYGVDVDVVGFDSGQGLAPTGDPRDLPNVWRHGAFVMDEPALRARLERARLQIGWIAETLPRFLATGPAPIGFCVFDVDHYHPTVDSLPVLRAPHACLLPRVHCLFDDVIGYTIGERNGERLAIQEFNAVDPDRWISPLFGMQHFVPFRTRFDPWVDKLFMAHCTDHPLYSEWDGLSGAQEMPLA
jgi:hypothetical protein